MNTADLKNIDIPRSQMGALFSRAITYNEHTVPVFFGCFYIKDNTSIAVDKFHYVKNWKDFESKFYSVYTLVGLSDVPLVSYIYITKAVGFYSVYQYFMNGGQGCYIYPMSQATDETAIHSAIDSHISNPEEKPASLFVSAETETSFIDSGIWGGDTGYGESGNSNYNLFSQLNSYLEKYGQIGTNYYPGGYTLIGDMSGKRDPDELRADRVMYMSPARLVSDLKFQYPDDEYVFISPIKLNKRSKQNILSVQSLDSLADIKDQDYEKYLDIKREMQKLEPELMDAVQLPSTVFVAALYSQAEAQNSKTLGIAGKPIEGIKQLLDDDEVDENVNILQRDNLGNVILKTQLSSESSDFNICRLQAYIERQVFYIVENYLMIDRLNNQATHVYLKSQIQTMLNQLENDKSIFDKGDSTIAYIVDVKQNQDSIEIIDISITLSLLNTVKDIELKFTHY